MMYILQEWDEKGTLDVYFWKLYKRDKVSCTDDKGGGTLGLILGRFFFLTYLEKLLWLLSKQYIEWIRFMHGKTYEKHGNRVHHHNLDEV